MSLFENVVTIVKNMNIFMILLELYSRAYYIYDH